MRLIHRQEKWVLTVQGWLLFLVSVTALMLFMLSHIHPFLSPISPIKSDILVVEGWIPDYAIQDAIREFEKGSYQKLITTGIPLEKGYFLAQYKNYADLAAATLLVLGFAPDKLVAAPAPDVIRNRTFASALAVRQWINNSELKVKSINLYTYDVHAQRSWLVFKQVFAPEIKVGVIAAKPIIYDPNYWWVSSEGVRSIISEAIAYIYARFVNWRA